MSLLSAPAIRRHMDWGSIVIDPFDDERLNTNSYDLELGPWFWRHKALDDVRPSDGIYAYEKVDASHLGGLWLAPGERVLGHTVEVVGGRVVEIPAPDVPDTLGFFKAAVDQMAKKRLRLRAVTTHLHATSTAGRHGLTVCQCAGWGDVGYVARWTLEIQNHTQSRFWLPVGAIICQMAFEQVEPPDFQYMDGGGRYQVDKDDWEPEAMLPGDLKVAR